MSKTRTLIAWGFLRLNDSDHAPMIAGDDDYGTSWVSTPVASYDPGQGVAVTASGREYTLLGPESPISAQRAFHTVWRLPRGRKIHRVAPEDVLRAIADAPARRERTAAETAESQGLKIEIYCRKIVVLAPFAGLGEAEVRRILGISLEEYEAMKSGSVPTGLSAEHAEQVFVYVAGRMHGHLMTELLPPATADDADETDFDVQAREQEERHERRRQRMTEARDRMEDGMAETRRHRLERAAFALPYLQLADPDFTDEQYAESLGVTPQELREILAEIPDDDDDYRVPPPGMRH